MVLKRLLNGSWKTVSGGKTSLVVNTKIIMRKCTRIDKNFAQGIRKNAKKCYNQKGLYISQCRSLLFYVNHNRWVGYGSERK